MKEEKHVQVGSKERIGDVWFFSANTYSNGGGGVDNETYKRLRENGFVFSRTNGAFQRQLNENSRYAVRRFIQSQRNIVEQMSTKKETEAEM